jgi:hypothetical protein
MSPAIHQPPDLSNRSACEDYMGLMKMGIRLQDGMIVGTGTAWYGSVPINPYELQPSPYRIDLKLVIPTEVSSDDDADE